MNRPRPHTAKHRVVLAIAVLALSVASARLLAAEPNANLIESFSFEHGTLERVFELRVPEGAVTASLEIRVRVEKGRVSWRLEDAEGNGRLTGAGIRGRVTGRTGPIEDPPPGTWKLTVATENATGGARLAWEVESPAAD
jgi:hypothetical protein